MAASGAVGSGRFPVGVGIPCVGGPGRGAGQLLVTGTSLGQDVLEMRGALRERVGDELERWGQPDLDLLADGADGADDSVRGDAGAAVDDRR
jgi:hypothetical protein